jgi:hypothetical protein
LFAEYLTRALSKIWCFHLLIAFKLFFNSHTVLGYPYSNLIHF